MDRSNRTVADLIDPRLIGGANPPGFEGDSVASRYGQVLSCLLQLQRPERHGGRAAGRLRVAGSSGSRSRPPGRG